MTFNSHELSESDLGKDASVLIMELNKGFQSTNLGIQCKSIAQFPSVLEKYPFPVVINSILLKVTQIFCDGNNYLRLCILRACTECRAHFKKLTVCEDIIRKLLPFTESNDPTVRALTLRLFGILNEITRDHLGVHHAILKQIESHYEVESDAAVWACHTIAPISSVFAGSLCPILCKILNNLSIDMDTKLKLLYLGKHMHHNSVVADKIRHCLTQMLETYNTTNFVTGILDTLTVLETRAPLHVPIQIDLLIKRLSIEQRPPLRQSILWNLLTLAENVSHHFDKSHILELSSLYHVKDCSKMDKSLILQIFYCLTASFHSVEFLTLPSGEFNTVRYYTPVDCIKSALQDDSSSYLLIRAIQLACKLTILKGENDSLKNTADDGSFEFSLDNDSAFQFNPGQFIQLFLYHFNVSVKDDVGEVSRRKKLWYLYDSQIPTDDLKCTYNLLVEFFSTFPLYTSKLHKMNFLEGLKLDGTVSTGLLSQFLCTIYAKLSQFLFPNPSMTTEVDTDINSVQLNYVNVLSKLTDSVKIEDSLSSTSSSPSAPTQNCITSVLSTIGLVFQLTGGSPLTQKEQIILVHSVAKCLGEEIVSSTVTSNSSGYRLSPWIVYQLARQANRYGQHEFAGKLYEKLSSLTITEKSHFWLTGLCEFSRMESKLINLTRNLEHDVQETLLIVNSLADSSTHSTTSRKQSWVVKLIQGLRTASEDACKIQTTIMCVGGSDGRWFQANYIQIRSLLLNSLSNLCSTVHHALRIRRWSGSIFMNQSCKSDPSHLQTSQCTLFNMNTPSNVIWLSNCVESWNTLLQEISKLRAQCLDADLETHRHLEAITQLVEFFIEILNLIDGSRYSSKVSSIGEHFSSRNDSNSFQTYESDPYGKIIPILRELMGKLFPDNNSNTPCIREWLPVIIYKVVQIASHWPRFFFQRLQTTTVRLVLLPKAGSNPDDVLTISSDICHMIQVMGVVQQRSRLEKQALLRRIKAVQIAINVHEICPETIKTNQFTKMDCIFSTKKIAQLKGDYFHCEFCIRFPQTELNNISSVESVIVTASNRQSDRIFCIHAHPILIDDFGSHWDLSTNAGASDESVLVRVESLPAVASVHTSNPLDQNHHQRMENQETVETPQVIGSHQSASSVSSKDSSSASHTFHQKSQLSKSKIASRSLEGWRSPKSRSKKITSHLKSS